MQIFAVQYRKSLRGLRIKKQPCHRKVYKDRHEVKKSKKQARFAAGSARVM